MKNMIKNEDGSIVALLLIVVVMIISLSTTVSLLGLVVNDHRLIMNQQDSYQQELLLRAEHSRSKLALGSEESSYLRNRVVEILEPERTTTYYIDTTTESLIYDSFLGETVSGAKKITSTATCKRSRSFQYSELLPTKKTVFRLLKHETLAQWQYFTDTDQSENAENPNSPAARVYFWGQDHLYGKVHSNSDIWLKNAGGGWPIFEQMVTTAGLIQTESGTPPYDEVFLGGYQENVEPIEYSATADEIRSNGIWQFQGSDCDIVYIKCNGAGANTYTGKILSPPMKEYPVRSWFPQDAGHAEAIMDLGGNWLKDTDTIDVNYLMIPDTTWAIGPQLNFNNNSYFIEQELWLEGMISGKVTFGCEDTIYITNDLYYAHTEIGEAPDVEGLENPVDWLGVVSENDIIIRYKHRDPSNNDEISAPNCDDIFLYGAYAAIGKGSKELQQDYACHFDGLFTFQYQHPHGSPPNYEFISPNTLDDTTYKWIDMQKYIFPIVQSSSDPIYDGFILHSNFPAPGFPSCGYPYESNGYLNSYPNNGPNYAYPYGTDYPWYNPVYPESQADIVNERGTLWIFGSIAQTRRGFVHRSGTDEYNHPGTLSPGNAGLEYVLTGSDDTFKYNYGGMHGSTGYQKEYFYDQRLMLRQPPDFPQVWRGQGEERQFDARTWYFRIPDEM